MGSNLIRQSKGKPNKGISLALLISLSPIDKADNLKHGKCFHNQWHRSLFIFCFINLKFDFWCLSQKTWWELRPCCEQCRWIIIHDKVCDEQALWEATKGPLHINFPIYLSATCRRPQVLRHHKTTKRHVGTSHWVSILDPIMCTHKSTTHIREKGMHISTFLLNGKMALDQLYFSFSRTKVDFFGQPH